MSESSPQPHEKKPAAEHVRWYVIAIGLLLLLVNTYWILMASRSGFIFTIFLMIMKIRFIRWPLHPGGYVLTTGGGLGRSWFAVSVSWAMKSVILRFGGARRFRQAAPFFLGLILGDYTLGCLWSIIGIALRMPTYGVWH
jgi:hypothetical protein